MSPYWQDAFLAKAEAELKVASNEELFAHIGIAIDESASSETKASPKAEEQPKTEQAKADPKPKSDRSTDPVDLWAKFDPPPLPADLLPAPIASFATEQGKLMGADPAGLALGALAVCAAAVPDKIKIKVKRHDRWMESTRLWVALVGEMSSKKSPILREAERPLRTVDHQLCRAYAEAKARFDALPANERRTTERPRHTRVLIEDVTVEAAQEILRDSPDGVLCVSDELSARSTSRSTSLSNSSIREAAAVS